MDLHQFNQALLAFLGRSPTPFHAVRELKSRWLAEGFEELREAEAWQLKPGRRYVVSFNDSTVAALRVGTKPLPESGFRLVGTHTDSPCLRVKPEPVITAAGCVKLGVEVYGGALLAPWFDRDLSLAGRVSYITDAGAVGSALIDFEDPIAVIPSLAIHLNREVNESRSINKQLELPPVVMLGTDGLAWREVLKERLARQGIDDVVRVGDFDLSFYDTQKPAVVGLKEDFICGARLDNLLSCFIAATALSTTDTAETVMVVCNDHEEVGSHSAAGAEGPFVLRILQRLAGSWENYVRLVDRSWMVSADNAHGIHPNYAERHDPHHAPALNGGPVLKLNANQRYASNSETATLFAALCDRAKVPFQRFVMRSDLACGSTIGPITAALLGIKTVDVGVPTWAMHSIRETAGTRDAWGLMRVLREFFAADLG